MNKKPGSRNIKEIISNKAKTNQSKKRTRGSERDDGGGATLVLTLPPTSTPAPCRWNAGSSLHRTGFQPGESQPRESCPGRSTSNGRDPKPGELRGKRPGFFQT